jgi:hypothetical protein
MAKLSSFSVFLCARVTQIHTKREGTRQQKKRRTGTETKQRYHTCAPVEKERNREKKKKKKREVLVHRIVNQTKSGQNRNLGT